MLQQHRKVFAKINNYKIKATLNFKVAFIFNYYLFYIVMEFYSYVF